MKKLKIKNFLAPYSKYFVSLPIFNTSVIVGFLSLRWLWPIGIFERIIVFVLFPLTMLSGLFLQRIGFDLNPDEDSTELKCKCKLIHREMIILASILIVVAFVGFLILQIQYGGAITRTSPVEAGKYFIASGPLFGFFSQGEWKEVSRTTYFLSRCLFLSGFCGVLISFNALFYRVLHNVKSSKSSSKK